MPFVYLFAVIVALMPGLANAASVLNPVGGNSWDLYVFGNGKAIYDILMGVKMLMVPDAGSSGFMMLLLLLATIGFVVLAVAAGFDPGKNLIRMFTYIISVWMITLCCTSITANVTIIDMVPANQGEASLQVSGVPLMVAMPAVLTSQVGHYFTQSFETYFTLPSSFKLSDGSGGQFNLFGKMMEEANQYSFSSPEMKQSLAAYTSDCVVPALALGRLSGPGREGTTLYGLDALLHSTNLIDTYESATHYAIMTTYYAPRVSSGTNVAAGMGVVETCNLAFTSLKADLTADGQSLLTASAEAWTKAGISAPFETAFSDMLTQASANGSVDANFTRPSGHILQQGFLNSMSGAFRTAAMQTGNSEILQAAAISQAEAQQKSAWVAGFSIFNNMMGYVFTVLQAFIFAVTPMVVVALLIPGMGRGIFTNYAQILVWLCLWMPMMALINFIITLFGGVAQSSVLDFDEGLTASNKGLYNERAKNLTIAAQFLGTMVPMLTWGIVKGAMAFTEFISHGVGSQFAGAAGASAASGNLSLNNMSMDNMSANKWNGAMSSSVGSQSTSAFNGVGAGEMAHQLGGQATTMNGSAVDASRAMQEGTSARIAQSQSVKDALSTAMNGAHSISDALSNLKKRDQTSGTQGAIQLLESYTKTGNTTDGTGHGTQGAKGGDTGLATAQSDSFQNKTDASVAVQMGTPSGLPISAGGKAGTGVDATHGHNQVLSSSQKTSGGESFQKSDGAATGEGMASGKTATMTTQGGTSTGKSTGVDHSEQAQLQQAYGHAMAQETAWQSSLESMRSLSQSMSFRQGVAAEDVSNLMARMDAIHNSAQSGEQLQAGMAGLQAGFKSEFGAAQQAVHETTTHIRGTNIGAPAGAPSSAIVTDAQHGLEAEIGRRKSSTSAAVEDIGQKVSKERGQREETTRPGSNSVETLYKQLPSPGQLFGNK